jgi:hypothetical protein
MFKILYLVSNRKLYLQIETQTRCGFDPIQWGKRIQVPSDEPKYIIPSVPIAGDDEHISPPDTPSNSSDHSLLVVYVYSKDPDGLNAIRLFVPA